MKSDFDARWAQSPASQRREPTAGEYATGIPCGPFDRPLYNELYFRLTSVYGEVAYAITASGQTPNEAVFTQLWEAINRAVQNGAPDVPRVYAGQGGGTASALTVGSLYPSNYPNTNIERAVVLFEMPAGFDNATGATLKVGGAPAASLRRSDGSQIQAIDLRRGSPIMALYDGSVWRHVGPTWGEIPSTLTNPTLYVSPSGSDDTTDGSTPETAFRQPRTAILVGRQRYPLSATTLNIDIADGSYQALGSLPAIAGTLNLIGNDTNPQNVILSGTATGGRGVNGINGGSIIADGITFQNSGTASHTIAVSSGDYTATNCRCVSTVTNTGGAHLYANPNASITIAEGNASQGAMGWLFWANGGTISIGSLTTAIPFTLIGSNSFSQSTARASDIGRIRLFAGVTFPGSATGVRYRVDDNSIISAFGNGTNAFPGDQPGVTYDNGLYKP